jgi:hypothetical protein
MSGRLARTLAMSALTGAALSCLVFTAPVAADNTGIPRRPQIAHASIGNLARPFFPDGINSTATVTATTTADDSSGGLRRPLGH